MLKHKLLTLLIALNSLAFSQIDSLMQAARNAQDDGELFNAYMDISNEYYQVLPDSCKKYSLKALEVAERMDYKKAIPAVQNDIGLSELHKENYLAALHWFEKALQGFLKFNNERSVLMTLNNIGACYSELQQPVKALPYLINAQEYAEALDHQDVLMLAELNLGNVYSDLGQFDLSIEYSRKSRSRITEEQDPYDYALLTYNIANTLLKRDSSTAEAGKMLNESFRVSHQYNFYNLEFMATNNLVTYYLNSEFENLDSARFWLDRCDSLMGIHNSPTSTIFNEISHADYDRALGNLNESIAHLKTAETILNQADEEQVKISLYYEFSKTYRQLKKFEQALHYYTLASQHEKSIYNEKNTMIFADLKTNHELEKKDQEIALNRKDLAFKNEKIKSDESRIKFFIGGTVLLLIILLGIVYFLIQKNKNNKLLKSQNALIEEQRSAIEHKQNEIIDSINYASRIQSAIIPKAETLRKQLKKGFVLYIPKDVVSGDFYWTEELNNNEVLVAVADCTGHGVPGAMVSIVCNNALNRAVREFGLEDTNHILDKTRELVIEEFAQHDQSVKDGMDISLAKINLKLLEIQWSGANNPIWIIKNKDSKVIEEIKGDKQPIGQFQHATPFTVHYLNLDKKDRIYLFSDGFADQFGGEQGKKMKYKKMKQLLLEKQHEPIEITKSFMETSFKEWKGKFEQLDDVCLIGIEL